MIKLNSIIRPIHRYISLAMSWKNNGLDYVSSVIFRNSWLDRYICVLDSFESTFISNSVKGTGVPSHLCHLTFEGSKVTWSKNRFSRKKFQLLNNTRYCHEMLGHEWSQHSPQKLWGDKNMWGQIGSQGSK